MVLTQQADIDAAIASADRVATVHERLVGFLRAGLTLAEVDAFVATQLRDLDCTSAFLNYKVRGHPPYPSHACLSPNDCIVHGTHTMTTRRLETGDLLSVDIGVMHDGFVGDAAWTYAIGGTDDLGASLMRAGRESLRLGIETLRPGARLVEWARAVQRHVERASGFHLVRGLGGHGYGRTLHGPPFVSNVEPSYPGEWPDAAHRLQPGTLLAVEPMLAVSTSEIRTEGNRWPIYTADGSLSVHYEADVLVTADGPLNLTQRMCDLPDRVG